MAEVVLVITAELVQIEHELFHNDTLVRVFRVIWHLDVNCRSSVLAFWKSLLDQIRLIFLFLLSLHFFTMAQI